MRMRRLAVPLLCTFFGLLAAADAAEPYLQFVQGLRAKGYFDVAGWYFDQLDSRDDLPPDIRAVLPFERAVTLLQGVSVLRSPEARADQLDQAERYLDQFIKAVGKDHPLYARANSEQAQILLGKAQVAVLQSRDPSNAADKESFQKTARGLVARARKIYQTAHDAHQVNFDKFPTFIDKESERAKWEERDKVQDAMIRAQLDLALCTYHEARTYSDGTKEYRDGLTKAATEFEQVNEEYRQSVAGLFARLWQGKCFEEQDDISKALGIYGELLSHDGNNAGLRQLQRKAKHFRLICLNHKQRHDYALVIKEADQWLRDFRAYAQTDDGLGIRWELVQALVKRADDRKLNERDKRALLIRAQSECARINRFAGRYKSVSGLMLAEIRFKLTGSKEDPKTFDDALIVARNNMDGIAVKEKAIAEAQSQKKPANEIAQLQAEFDNHMTETIRVLRIALSLAGPEATTASLNEARYRLAYMFFRIKQNYEAAVIGEFVGRKYQQDDENRQIALDSAYIAMISYIQAFNEAAEEGRDAELNAARRTAQFIIDGWPNGDRAMDAMLNMGQIFRQLKQPVEAAQWYNRVPQGVAQYASAQIDAGQSFWAAYQNAFVLPEEERPPQEQLTQWRSRAEQHLTAGITELQKSPQAADKSRLVFARVSLAQILNMSGKYQAAAQRLNDEPYPVLQAVQVKDERQRPDKGVQSREFASLAYRLLVRADIGVGDFEKARSTMQTLEQIAGAEDAGAVVAVYVQLGRALEEELQRLKVAGENQRLDQVRQSFETFLADLAGKDTQTYNSLVWVGETYFGLGSSADDDPTIANPFFEKAGAAYEEILTRAANDAGFVDEQRLTGVKLRVAACRRRANQFDAAEQLVKEIIAKSPMALDAQIEAAQLYQDWGAQPGNEDKYLTAINGDSLDPKKKKLWGWGFISRRLQIIQDSANAREEYETRLLESRYNSALCRTEYALAQSREKERTSELNKAEREIVSFTLVAGEMPEEEWRKFDTLYQRVLQSAGKPIVPLEKPKSYESNAASRIARVDEDDEPQTTRTAGTETPVKSAKKSGLSTVTVVVLVLVLGGGAVFAVFMMSKRDTKRRVAYDHAAVPLHFSDTPAAPRKKRRPAPESGQQQSRPQSPGEEPAAPRKRRPKPPE